MRFLLLALLLTLPHPAMSQSAEPPVLVLRADDMGMSHGQNLAFQALLESGLPVSVSVMFSTPWWKHAVEILREHPHAAIGVHLTLNSEWAEYRWGPVLGRSAVPSLVDEEGYFFPSRSRLYGNNPRIEEIEAELRAQVDRAIGTGLPIDYVDYHMGAAMQTPETRAVVERIARNYGLAISRFFGEEANSVTYSAPLGTKTEALVNRVAELTPGALHLQVLHIAPAQSDMNALTDLNPGGLPNMATHRHEELQAILSDTFREAVSARNVRLVTYRDLVRERGLDAMARPEIYRD